MRDLILALIRYIDRNEITITDSNYRIGCCLEIQFEADNAYQVTIDRLEVVAELQTLGAILSFDSATFKILDNQAVWHYVHHFYADISDKKAFNLAVLRSHLERALVVLESTEEAEWLWPFFKDYNTIERAALVWRLQQQAHIADYAARKAIFEISEHLCNNRHFFPLNTPGEVSLFGHWLKTHPNNILSHAPQRAPQDDGYYKTIA